MIMYWYNFTKKMVRVMIKPLSLFLKSERLEKIKKSVDDKIDSFYEESLRLRADWGLLIKISLLTLVQLFFYYLIPYFALAWRNSRQCFACDDDARFDRDDYLAVSDSRWSRRGRTQFFDGVLNVYFRSWKIGFSDAFVACGHLLPRNFCWNRCLGSQA